MASQNVKLRISAVLSDLSPQEFKTFLHHLLARREEPRVRRNNVEGKDHLDIADLLVCFFTEEGAPRVAEETLRQAGFHQQATELAAGGQCSAPPPSNPAASNSGSVTSEKHFVDQHRLDLIRKVSNINSILDELLDQNIIKQEAYDKIISLPTTQEKVRELYCGPLKAGNPSKDIFYKSLVENEPWLIDDLKKKK